MLPPLARTYLVTSLEGYPRTLAYLLRGLAETDPFWDARPDLARFSLREVVAHLAATEALWLERADLTLRLPHPQFAPVAPVDEVAREVAQSGAVLANLAEFQSRRAQYAASSVRGELSTRRFCAT